MTITTRPPTHVRPTAGDALEGAAQVIGAPPIYGPPILFLIGPWLLLVLLLIPPAALLITLALVVVLAAGLLAAAGALVATPYLLVRHVLARRAARRRRAASEHRPARRAPAASRATGPRGWRPVKQPAGVVSLGRLASPRVPAVRPAHRFGEPVPRPGSPLR